MTSQPCWTCQNYYGGCSWTARDPATGQLQFKPVEGWEAVHRVYGEYQRYGIKAVESYEIIKAKQAQRDIKTQSDLAVACGIYPTTFSYKLRNGAWTCDDIRALDKVLRFSGDEIVQIVRC